MEADTHEMSNIESNKQDENFLEINKKHKRKGISIKMYNIYNNLATFFYF